MSFLVEDDLPPCKDKNIFGINAHYEMFFLKKSTILWNEAVKFALITKSIRKCADREVGRTPGWEARS